MKNVSKGTKVMMGLAAALLTGALSVRGAQADEGMTQRTGPGSAERTNSETVVVSGIDRANRTVTLTNDQGERETMSVPSDVRAYDTLKVGDHVDIDYREAIAISLAPPGSKPSMSQRTSGSRMAEGPGAAMAGRETTISAKVVSVDVPNNKVTFKGPKGNIQVVTVSDPTLQKKLPNLKPGQVVQFVYTEAVAASIRPSAK
jgi:Cu/Ag efflux protein CusF